MHYADTPRSIANVPFLYPAELGDGVGEAGNKSAGGFAAGAQAVKVQLMINNTVNGLHDRNMGSGEWRTREGWRTSGKTLAWLQPGSSKIINLFERDRSDQQQSGQSEKDA